ncbi:MAG: Ig-like domain-containing protein [Dehalococcoidia bacterium]
MKKPKWHAKALYLIFALALVVGLMPLTVLAGHADIVIAGPPYAKEGETVTFEAATNPTADSVDWYIDGTYDSTDNTAPFELTTTFPALSAGMHVISATGWWGGLDQDAEFEILIGVGLIPQQEYNIIGTEATFCVPDLYMGHVMQWRFESSFYLNGAWSIVSGGDPFDNCVTVHGSGWGELVIYADTEAFTDYPATTLMAIKKWGKIFDTWLFAWDSYTEEEIYDSGETQVWWNENLKKWEGEAYLYDLIIGNFITDGGEEFLSFADGADVEWWVMDARAPVHDLPSGIPAGDWMDPMLGLQPGLVTLIDDMQAAYPSRLVGFLNGNPEDCSTKYIETESGDADIDGMMTGLTGVELIACGEEAVKIVVVAKYPDRLHYDEWPVFPEIISWNFWTQELEKVPQVRWAGEKIVLEKQFGTSYTGFDVCFTLENESPGTLEAVVPQSNWMPATGMQDTVWTTVDEDGVARCIVFSEKPGECDVACALYDELEPWQLINQHGFVVFFLKFEELTLGNMQGERAYHDDGLWDPVLDSGMVYDAFPNDIWDPTANWAVDEFVGKTIEVWKGEEEDDGSITFIGDLQIREIESNTADTVVVTTDWTTIPSPPGPDVQWYYEISDPVWDPTLDDLSQELNVSQDALLRTRVKGWFMGDNLSWREDKLVDLDGDGFAETRLPEGRWVLPDDWPILAGAEWAELRPHYDIMCQPNDNIMSEIDSNLDHAEELGDYLEWTLDERPTRLDIPGALVAQAPVIGPYSTLDTYSPTIDHDYKLDRKTIVRNGKLNWWDCPMPPAKIVFKITEGVGFFKDADKGDIYYEWVERDLNNPGPEGIVYTNPFYEEMIASSPFIPPFINNGGYDWDSYGFEVDSYGPYPFWDIINQLPGVTPYDPQHPTKVEVYSDNHGEAMVWLNGDWNLDLSAWLVVGGYDIPTGEIVGNTTVKAIADYPYLRKHLYVVSNDVEKTWTWGKDIRGNDPEPNDPPDTRMVFQVDDVVSCLNPELTNYKMAFIWACDRDGFPVVGERVEWNLGTVDGAQMAIIPNITNEGVSICLPDIDVENGFLAGTYGSVTNLDRTMGESFMKEPGPEELALWEKFWPDDECHHAVAAVLVYTDELATRASLTAWLFEEEGTITRQWNLDFAVVDEPDDPLMLGDANQDNVVNTGDITKVKRIYFGIDPATIGADANQDSFVDAGDITQVKRIYLGT